jgi:hypothetical protein
MLRPISPARHWPLAITLALLGACADGATAPLAPADPSAAIIEPNVVSNTNDSGIGSLRWTLSWTIGGETIRFDPSLAGQTIALDSVLYIRKPVTIEGPTGAGITIDARGKAAVFRVPVEGTFTLRNLSITGGSDNLSAGGAILSYADVVLENTVVHGNTGSAGSIVFAQNANVTLVNSTVSGNTSSNVSTSDFGAVMGDTVALINSTVAYNPSGGVGSPVTIGRVILRNSILSNNGGENCTGSAPATAITRQGANISDDDTCGGPTQIMIGDPEIGPLANNGGPTMTHALLAGSPAIDAGSSCTVTVDQRYTPRDADCDVGAFEFADFTTVAVTIDAAASVNQSSGSAVLTGTVQCSRDETFSLAVQLAQQQKTGKTTTTVDAANVIPVECSTTPRPWSASMVLTSGSFQVGSATAKAETVSMQPGVTPTSATGQVRLFWGRR